MTGYGRLSYLDLDDEVTGFLVDVAGDDSFEELVQLDAYGDPHISVDAMRKFTLRLQKLSAPVMYKPVALMDLDPKINLESTH